ncbi:hypothetical protein BJ165DRAFT_1610369 [Panaeolus papilionaceus]|nr:hypothetical protein BJ165DRAFT_1610369 [Panaeolus papilionaceus]
MESPGHVTQKSELEEMRLELDLMKKQMRSLMGHMKEDDTVGGDKSKGGVTGTVAKSIARTVDQIQDPGEVETPKAELTKKSSESETCQLQRDLERQIADLEGQQPGVEHLECDARKQVMSLGQEPVTGNGVEGLLEEIKVLGYISDKDQQGARKSPIQSDSMSASPIHTNGQTSVNILQQEMQRLIDAHNLELDQMKQKLQAAESREKEARDSLKLLARTDSVSIADLEQKVVALNDKIFEAAASSWESIGHYSYDLTQEERKKCREDAVELIGEPIFLMAVEEGQRSAAGLNTLNPLLLQIVFQVALTKACALKIERWVPNCRQLCDFLDNVHKNILTAEEPAVSRQWRAVTRAHTQPITSPWKEGLIWDLMQILRAVAWSMPNREHRLSFEHKLDSILEDVQDLRIAMGEKFTSAEIRPSLVPPNSQFNPNWMDDAFADAGAKVSPTGPIQCVVGTTGFGLKKLINGQRGLSGELLYESVMSPKVILESTLLDALKPIDSVMCGKT